MSELSRIQEYIRLISRQHHEMLALPPFTVYFHETASGSDYSYAIPDDPEEGDVEEALRKLQTLFTERERKPSLQFIEELFPNLPPALRSSAWDEAERSPVMFCTPQNVHPSPEVPGLSIVTLTSESSLAEIREGLDVNALGFNPQAERATDQQAEEFRRDLVLSLAFTARLNEEPVGAGMFTDIHEGLTELVGITTLEAFHGRGIAAALTAYITKMAFQHGATLAFLSSANEQAARVYERVGFLRQGTLVSYVAPS